MKQIGVDRNGRQANGGRRNIGTGEAAGVRGVETGGPRHGLRGALERSAPLDRRDKMLDPHPGVESWQSDSGVRPVRTSVFGTSALLVGKWEVPRWGSWRGSLSSRLQLPYEEVRLPCQVPGLRL